MDIAVKKSKPKSKAENPASSSGKGTSRQHHPPKTSIAGDMERHSPLKLGDHACSFYGSEEERRDQVVAFVNAGLKNGEKVVYAIDAQTPDRVIGYFSHHERGIEPFIKSGQLEIHSTSSVYAPNGVFETAHMIARLKMLLEHAFQEGYTGLRATGEMTWARRGWPGSERLMEYELKLNSIIAGSKCLALCQYHVPSFRESLLSNIRASHSVVVEKGTA